MLYCSSRSWPEHDSNAGHRGNQLGTIRCIPCQPFWAMLFMLTPACEITGYNRACCQVTQSARGTGHPAQRYCIGHRHRKEQ